jgi:hypothetical protein
MTMCGSFFFLTLVQLPLMYSKLGVWGPPVLSKNGGEIKSQDECNKHWKKKEGTKLVFSAKLILWDFLKKFNGPFNSQKER